MDSHPPAQLTLLRGGHPLASSPPRGGDTPRQSVRVSPSPNALRLEFREASEEDEGEYECQARSDLGVTRASLTLRVQGEEGDNWGHSQGGIKGGWGHPGCESGAGGSKGKNAAKSSRLPAATKVLVRPSAEVAEGTQVTLTCQAPRAPPGTVYAWFKNGRWVTEGPEPSLELRGHRSDAGLYSCQAGRGPRAAPAALSVLCELGGRHLRGEGTGRGHRDAPPPRGRGCPACVATSRWR